MNRKDINETAELSAEWQLYGAMGQPLKFCRETETCLRPAGHSGRHFPIEDRQHDSDCFRTRDHIGPCFPIDEGDLQAARLTDMGGRVDERR